MAETGKRKRIAAAVSSALLLALAGATTYLFAVPIDLSGYNSQIESFIESRTGRKVALRALSVKVLPSPDMEALGVEAFFKGKKVASAERVRLRFSFIPALFGRYIVQALEVSGGSINATRGVDGKVDLVEFIRGGAEGTGKRGGGSEFRILKASIEEGSAFFTDLSVKGAAPLRLRHIGGYLYESKDGYAFNIDSTLLPGARLTFSGTGSERAWTLRGTGAIEGADLDILTPYIAQAAELRGKADIHLEYDMNEKSEFKSVAFLRGATLSLPGLIKGGLPFSGSARAALTIDGENLKLNVSDIELALKDGFGLSGSLALSGPKRDLSFEARLESTPVELAAVKKLVQASALPEMIKRPVGEAASPKGTLRVAGVEAAGRLNAFKREDILKKKGAVKASVALSGAGFHYRGLGRPFESIDGKLSLLNGVIGADLSGGYGKGRFESIRASLNDIPGDLSLNLFIDASIDGDEALALARDASRLSGSAFYERLSNSSAGGTIDLKLTAAGELRGDRGAEFSGTAIVRDGAFFTPGMPVTLTYVDGPVAFDNERISTGGLSVGDGHSKVSLKGSIRDYSGEEPSFEAEAEGSFAGETFERLKANLSRLPFRDANLGGRLDFRAAAHGGLKAFSLDGRAAAGEASLEYGRFLKKASGFPLNAFFSVRKSPEAVDINHLRAAFGGSEATIKGRVSFDGPSYDIIAMSRGVDLSDLDNVSPFLVSEYDSSGVVSFDFNARREPKGPTVLTGGAAIRGGRFDTPILGSPVEGVDALISFDGNSASLTVENLKAGRTELNGRVDVLDIAGRKISFDVNSAAFYPEDLIPRQRPEDKGPKEPRRPITGSGRFTASVGSLWGYGFQDLKADVALNERGVFLSPLGLNLYDGGAGGSLSVYLDPAYPLSFEGEIRLTDVDIQRLMESLGVKRQVFTGKLNGVVALSGERGASPFTSGLNGTADLSATGGRIWRFPVITGIFSIVNIVSLNELFDEGLPYSAIKGDFQMSGGVISTRNLALESFSMRMSATGEINAAERKIDALLAIKPFVTIDKIVSNIPLAGWIITGKDKSVVSMYFGVEGPLKDPDVDVKPVTTIEKGVFGILKRLIETPIRLFSPKEKKEEK